MDIAEPVIQGAPFFIQWGVSSPHPATTSPEGCVLESLKVASPEQIALERLVNVLDLDVIVEGGTGPEATYEIVLDCPKGAVRLK
jgi:hypothetical protein